MLTWRAREARFWARKSETEREREAARSDPTHGE